MISAKKKFNWKIGCNVMLVGFLVSVFLLIQWAMNLGKYTLQLGQSMEFRVNPKAEQVEYYSILHLSKTDDSKLALGGREYWSVDNSELHYDISQDNVFMRVKNNNGELVEESVKNTSLDDVYIDPSQLIVQYQGEKIFDVTNNKPYTITITNVDDKPARFEAQVADH